MWTHSRVITMSHVLQLNADYSPMKVTSWERAVEMLLDGTVISVEDLPDRFIRSERLVLPWPAVIALRRYRNVRSRVRFNARAVLARDQYTCQYCGWAPAFPDGRSDRSELTLDHVVPRAQAREGKVYLYWARKWANTTSWENATTACKRCNQHKANRTPQQANMTLRALPRLPTQADILRMSLARLRHLPVGWEAYLPRAAQAAADRAVASEG